METNIIKTHTGYAITQDGMTVGYADDRATAEAMADNAEYAAMRGAEFDEVEPPLPGLFPLFDQIQMNKEYAS